MLVAVGLNQKGATVADREVLAIPAEQWPEVLAGYAALGGVDEVVVLSTCYRVELYAATRCPAAASMALRQAMQARAGRDLPLFELHGEEAFRHLVRVAASLESAIVGEPQIQGQVKDAFQRAVDVGTAGKELTTVLSRALAAAKRVRTETAVGRAGVSWGHAAVALAEKVLGPLAGCRAVVLGAGEMARLSAQHLRDQKASVVVLNRTVANAEALAAELGATARPLEALEEELRHADVVISAAPAAPAAFAPAAMAALVRSRRRRIVLVDLAVPRAIPAETGAIPDVYLCDVDDLDRVMKAALAERATAAHEGGNIVEEEVQKFARAEAERRAAPLIQEMRSRAAEIAREEVERTLRRLGEDPELARRLDAMAGSIVSKLLHAPSARLRRAATEGGAGEPLVEAAVQIFGLSAPAHARRGEAA
ncbi:glutamyl-tRNA reductase [Anaeromyxobacter oryzae]|uniref:Glutamyl-tRNA reductase n=1 Tax=Anaeromyxobacter oryzae TaxID=2918170 RepID=A0ABN6N4S2_9BACT|nr:glutamyl-tRNA reductase [Anaeromyxobacter oryzae]BDG06838.1 glutamyl-tRNA reductase [Anaeromyxobacter oryzae]